MTAQTWIEYFPAGLQDTAKAELADVATRLDALCRESDPIQRSLGIERLRQREKRRVLERRLAANQRLVAAMHLLVDLAKQGWSIRVRRRKVEISKPDNPLDPEKDRRRIRQQLHAERDEQLRQESIRTFIKGMESARVLNGKRVSIFSLLRDGRDLIKSLKTETQPIQPYLQFVRGEERCELTNLRLVDIWRYFRHTWTTPYKSVPGRTMMIIVRDRAAPFHPVIGIAALSSATVGLTVRDEFIGWTLKQVAERISLAPSAAYAKWLLHIVDDAIAEVYKQDLVSDGVLSPHEVRNPTAELIKTLVTLSREHRKEHYRFMQGADYKDFRELTNNDDYSSDSYWDKQARTLLFRSKREQDLAHLLHVRLTLNASLGPNPSSNSLKDFVQTREGRLALAKIIRKAKADRVGTVMADLAICGAIPPYNEVLGGKLVAMLMASPEVVAEYSRRYSKTPSIIASSMAGRAIVRPSSLVFISTTSLYGRRPNQYDRISIPADRIAKDARGNLQYKYFGRTKGFGTFQFSNDAVEAMATLLAQTANGQRVNSVFGEGTNPRLRKIRDGLDALGLQTNMLLDHGAPRLAYGMPLIRNLADYLLGIDAKPYYIVPIEKGEEVTACISKWWYERWCRLRLGKEGLVDQVEAHTLVYPIQHGGRVKLPPPLAEEPYLFEE